MTSRLGKHLLRVKSKTENFGLFALYPCYFFVCCLDASWLTFVYHWGNSVTHLVLITAFGLSVFGLKVTRMSWVSTPNWVPSGLCHNRITHLGTQPKSHKLLAPDLPPDFLNYGNVPNTQNSYSLTLWCLFGLHKTSLDAKFSFQNFSLCWSIKSTS